MSKGIYKRTKTMCDNMSKASKGKKKSKLHRKNMLKYKQSKEWKDLISNKLKGRKMNRNWIKKIADFHRGKKLSKIHRLHIKKAPHFHHIDGIHNHNKMDNRILISNKSHYNIISIYYQYIKRMNLSIDFKYWLRRKYEIKRRR